VITSTPKIHNAERKPTLKMARSPVVQPKSVPDKQASTADENTAKLAKQAELARIETEKKAQEQKLIAEKAKAKKLAAKRKADAALAKRKAVAKQKQLAAQIKGAQQQMMAQQLAQEQQQLAANAQDQQVQKEIDKYRALIVQAISQNWVVPGNTNKDLSCQLLINVGPGGSVLNVNVVTSSGNSALDQSAITAVYKTSPLPVPSDPELFDKFRMLRLTVKPQNIVSN
jgi:colicin import membrane protein